MVISLLLLILILILDYATGKDISVSILYLIPILLISWNIGFLPAILFSLVAAVLKIYTDIWSGLNYTNFLLYVWECSVDFGIFSAFTFSFVKIKSTLKSLEEKNEQLHKVNEVKNEFLGMASHDLKNPLNNIYNFAAMIEENDSLPPNQVTQIAHRIVNISLQMFQLIDSLITSAAMELEELNCKNERVDLLLSASSIIQQFSVAAEKKSLKIHLEKNSEKVIADADYDLTLQVLDNLISNAIKFSPPNKNIWVKLLKPANPQNKVRIEIKDEGPGFSEDDKLKIFNRFSRLSARPTGGESSTGLGLFTVKKLVEAMNGNVFYQSEPGEGALFIVELPMAKL